MVTVDAGVVSEGEVLLLVADQLEGPVFIKIPLQKDNEMGLVVDGALFKLTISEGFIGDVPQ